MKLCKVTRGGCCIFDAKKLAKMARCFSKYFYRPPPRGKKYSYFIMSTFEELITYSTTTGYKIGYQIKNGIPDKKWDTG